MKSTLVNMAATGPSSLRAAGHTAPIAAAQGTGLPFAGTYAVAAEVAVAGVRTTDLPGSPPRGAPV